VGQYITYRTALDYIDSHIPLYVAITQVDYQIMFEHPLAQRVMQDRLDQPIPFVVFDPIAEEIVKWIPPQ